MMVCWCAVCVNAADGISHVDIGYTAWFYVLAAAMVVVAFLRSWSRYAYAGDAVFPLLCDERGGHLADFYKPPLSKYPKIATS